MQSNNKRIAKNTALLYLRQFISMIISFFTVGIMLNALGEVDYGINNVVGGIIGMLSFLTGSLASGSQRFLAYDMVSKDKVELNKTFCAISYSYIILGLVVLFLAETIGLWFLNYKMNIPSDRMIAANWVFQSTVIQFVLGFLTAPYMSVVIAREQMNIFAYVGMSDVVIRLLIVYLIVICPFDRLIFLSFLGVIVSLLQQFFYIWYCKSHYEEATLHLFLDIKKVRDLLSFSGWNVIGYISSMLSIHGINILLNLFFNPAVNAAQGIAYRINAAIVSFSENFFAAVKPQVTKSYASNDINRMHALIFFSSRFSFYLMLIFCIPISLNVNNILLIWLGTPPLYTEIFIQFVLIRIIVDVFSLPLVAGIQATGRIKYLQLTVSVIYLFILPVAYLFLYLGYPPDSTMWVHNIFILIALGPRLYICKKEYNLPVIKYLKNIILRCFSVAILIYFVTYHIVRYIPDDKNIISLVASLLFSGSLTILLIGLLGVSKLERKQIYDIFKSKLLYNKL